jgi:hypothetical protein
MRMGWAATRVQRALERHREACAKENPPAKVAIVAIVADSTNKTTAKREEADLRQVATVATVLPLHPPTVATVATIAGGLSRESPSDTPNSRNNRNSRRGSLLHPEDARELAEAVSYLRGKTREEATEAGKAAARDPSTVPLSDYEATLNDCGLAYWWIGDRYYVQGGHLREWLKKTPTPSRRWGK